MNTSDNIGCESLDAYVDGELTGAENSAFAAHLSSCENCSQQIEHQLRLRALLRSNIARPIAGDGLRLRILNSLPGEQPFRTRPKLLRREWMSMAAAASLGAILASSATLYLTQPSDQATWQQAIITSHLRAMRSGHVIDVASSNRHTVKPWFGGKTEIAPVVLNLTEAGYTLVGGRLEIPEKEALPVLVYQAGRHVISVYVRPSDGVPNMGTAKIGGYSIVSWLVDDLVYSAVSDADSSELVAFHHAFENARRQLP